MLLITLFALTFIPLQANLEYVMIKFADVMKKMVNAKKIILYITGINRSRKGLEMI